MITSPCSSKVLRHLPWEPKFNLDMCQKSMLDKVFDTW